MDLTSLVTLLQTALMLLSMVSANPALPQASSDEARQVAQQAITTATSVLSSNGNRTATTPPVSASFSTTGSQTTEPPGSYHANPPSIVLPTNTYTPPTNATFCNGVGVPCSVIPPTKSSGIACTADAMRCSDGSYVGRSGPNCTFTCPTVSTKTSDTGCVTSSNGQTTCTGGVTSSGPGFVGGSSGGGTPDINPSCTIPSQPTTSCSGAWNFLPTDGSTNGKCNGSWLCVNGM